MGTLHTLMYVYIFFVEKINRERFKSGFVTDKSLGGSGERKLVSPNSIKYGLVTITGPNVI